MDRLGRVADEHVPVADAEFAFDLRGAVDDRLGLEVGGDDGVGNLAGAVGIVLVEDDDVAESLVRGFEAEQVGGRGLRLAGGWLVVDDRQVVGNGVGVDDGNVEGPLGDGNLVVVVEQAGVGEARGRRGRSYLHHYTAPSKGDASPRTYILP